MEMGEQYGNELKDSLTCTLSLLQDYFSSYNISYSVQKFPYRFQRLIESVGIGSDLKFDDVVILNGMETLASLVWGTDQGRCSFAYTSSSSSDQGMVGRLYDFSPPFDQIAAVLVVVTFKESGLLPVTVVSLPGQIFCPTCVNSAGVFAEFNNGEPTGGFFHDDDRHSMMVNLRGMMQDSASLAQFQMMARGSLSDYSVM